jgi:rubrerythrin
MSDTGIRSIGSAEELLAYSLAMETEAVERYNDLADQMEMHHNYEVADLFRKLAKIEGLHIDNVNQASSGKELPELRFINPKLRELTLARLALVSSIRSVLASGLAVIGAEAPEEMR